eukprot:COSAG02_NODE_34672_length_480_cov_1.036745_1_plen_44_part_01
MANGTVVLQYGSVLSHSAGGSGIGGAGGVAVFPASRQKEVFGTT